MTARPRVLIRQMHLWLGLTLGALFAMLGLTGSALSFYVEIDALLHPEIRVETTAAAPGWSSPVWDRALGTARTRHPGETGIWSFEVTGRPGVIPARYYAPHHHHDDMEMLWIAPDGGRVLRDAPWGDYLMTWLYDLHMNLLAGDTGRQIIGWSGLVMVLLLATGLAVWWPRGTWAKALAFKRDAVPIRRLRDLHKLPGLWSWLLLLMFVVTGVMLALPGERDQLLSATVAPVADTPMPRSMPSERAPISVQTALTAGHRAMPDARLAWIDVPGEPDGVFRLRVGVPGDPSQRFPHSLIYIDQFSG
ncbi:MAG: PepSY-associated TM helix domain-containing protein, partial [Sphingobium sp.]